MNGILPPPQTLTRSSHSSFADIALNVFHWQGMFHWHVFHRILSGFCLKCTHNLLHLYAFQFGISSLTGIFFLKLDLNAASLYAGLLLRRKAHDITSVQADLGSELKSQYAV